MFFFIEITDMFSSLCRVSLLWPQIDFLFDAVDSFWLQPLLSLQLFLISYSFSADTVRFDFSFFSLLLLLHFAASLAFTGFCCCSPGGFLSASEACPRSSLFSSQSHEFSFSGTGDYKAKAAADSHIFMICFTFK